MQADDDWKGEHLIRVGRISKEERHRENAKLGNALARIKGYRVTLSKRVAHGKMIGMCFKRGER